MNMTGTAMPKNNTDEVQVRIQLCRERRASAIDLSDLGLSQFPDEIKDMKHLRSINVSENSLTELPDYIDSYSYLECLDISYNKLLTLPDAIGNLGSLEQLNVRCNELTAIPQGVGKLAMLNSLDISYNQLSTLPEIFDNLSRLEYCNIRGNSIGFIPEKIRSLIKPKQISILQHMEQIVTLSGRNSFSDAFFLTAKPHIDCISEKLDINSIQAVLFSHIVSEYEGSPVSLREIARSLNCSQIRIMQYGEDLSALANKKLLKLRKNKSGRYGHHKGEITYRIPQEVADSLIRNERYAPANSENVSILELFTMLEDLFEQRIGHQEISYEELTEEIDVLLHDNRELTFAKKLKEYNLPLDDRMMLIRFCHFYVNRDEDEMDLDDISSLFEHKSHFISHKRKLITGEHNLLSGGFIENTNSDGFNNREYFKLTDKSKRPNVEFLPQKPNRRGRQS